MAKFKSQNKFKILNPISKAFSYPLRGLLFLLLFYYAVLPFSFAQAKDVEFSVDVRSSTYALPKVFKPNIDLSGRGTSYKEGWPHSLAAEEVLDKWQQEIGFSGIYRMQYNLWEMRETEKIEGASQRLLNSYESVFKRVSESAGVVIVNIFGMPAGMGRVLDKTSAGRNLRELKNFIKPIIRYLSCVKKYNIWYEVWSAPDREDFFLGRKQDYLNLYRAVAEIIQELQAEYKIHIPLGGPSSSWWFQNEERNTVITPEKSLLYSLIKFCYRYRLPLDFITWHSFTSDPQADKEATVYKKSAIALIREWLSYFRFDRGTALIVSEWNYDSGANILPERAEKANIAASYIFSRLKNMHEAGLDHQVYFALEDFHNPKEGVRRNLGAFSFSEESFGYKGEHKVIYNAFRILARLGNNMFSLSQKPADDFIGAIAAKRGEEVSLAVYNYIDPAIGRNYISRNISTLSGGLRKIILRLEKSGRLEKIIRGQLDLGTLRLDKKLAAFLKKAQELNMLAQKYASLPRNAKISLKGLKGDYHYQRYEIGPACSAACGFEPVEEKYITASDLYQEKILLQPYSVQMVILKKKPKEIPPVELKNEAAQPAKPAENGDAQR